MTSRICSILVTLALLGLGAPAHAADGAKGKKSASAKSDDDDKDKDEKDGDSKDDEEELGDSGVWERPPPEEEAPPAEAKKEKKKAKETPGDGLNVWAGLVLGYGIEFDDRFAVNPYGLAAGVRLGYTLDIQVYVGLYYAFFLGNSDVKPGTQGFPAEPSANYWGTPSLEIGYDWWLGSLIIRPSMAFGVAFARWQRGMQIAEPARTVSSFFFAPALSVIYPWDEFFLGGQLIVHQIAGDGVSGLAPYVNFGMRFDSNELF